MVFNNQPDSPTPIPENPAIDQVRDQTNSQVATDNKSRSAARLEQIQALPRRNKLLHWGAFILSVVSLVFLSLWVFSPRGAVPAAWIWLEAGLSVIFALEFFTRSGFRWTKARYLMTHFFDFVAFIPVLLLVHHGFLLENAWLWLIFVARGARVIDRFLGDGFLRRTFWALIEGFEEEISDRVLENILRRLQADMDQAEFSRGIAEALQRNKAGVLKRIHLAGPQEGALPKIAHLVKIDTVLERAEERAYDAIVGIFGSSELDQAIRDVVNSTFSRIRKELSQKSWRQKIQIRSPWR